MYHHHGTNMGTGHAPDQKKDIRINIAQSCPTNTASIGQGPERGTWANTVLVQRRKSLVNTGRGRALESVRSTSKDEGLEVSTEMVIPNSILDSKSVDLYQLKTFSDSEFHMVSERVE